MQCNCLRCGKRFTLKDAEGERFRAFFEERGVEPPPVALGICPQC
jgi:hypothetical protein